MKFIIVYEVKNDFGEKIVKQEYTQRPTLTIKKVMNIAEFGISVFPCASSIYSRPCLCFTDKWRIKRVKGEWEEIDFQKGIEEIKKAVNAGAMKKIKI